MCTMATRHEFTTIGIVGIVAGDHGRNCDEHSVCGNVLSESEDVVVRLRKVQVLVDGKEYSLSIIVVVVLPHPTYLIIVYY